ncbi:MULTISPECIES: hypothetical protein [unclassified Methylobacterium]|uniref:hypothetical protein n=1 Tax=unclassified Methylobacterium TaxID=2615210 RepID=UPI0011C20495|nr:MULTISPECIES: hypothetical protein [unclassified Methylobacterium]QEE37886.1 hypothetical protein FVA80_01865 [Methylobacterium sp. WL1]TXN59408.1 hypothetical protein FV241_02545 [Methylobacterium sp. WL2]
MGSELLAAIDAEIDAIEIELAGDVRVARLKALRELRKLYVSSDRGRQVDPQSSAAGSSDIEGSASNSSAQSRTINRRIAPHRSQAVDAIALHLKNRTGPVPTKDLLEHIASLGIDVGGSNPLNNLSAILSNSGRFDSQGRSGWTLRKLRTDAEIKIEAMHQAALDTIGMMDDEEIAENLHYLDHNRSMKSHLTSKLKVAYKEILEEDYINDGSNTFKDIVETLLRNEYKSRFVYNADR